MTSEIFKQVFADHKDWLGIAESFVKNKTNAEDVVSEMYLSLNRWADERIINPNGTVNRSYIYLTIRSVAYTFLKEQKMYEEADNESVLKSQEDIAPSEKLLAWNRLIDKIDNFIETWEWYDKTVFKLYKDTPYSLRGLAKETDISWMSLHATISRCKGLIKDKFSEDYEDYKNGDYHLIK